ncbi:sporulation-specific N-acetylmuramoyl-L-alanine amidase CwlC [Gottschalkia purinilytica]|uniref:Sporulation-specific N-acetylmuramoyl-L-alanine amidase CwlC n=1 Tax=Gottschalkia purinilytica TaxID=1503 RepID=A0A0L0W6R8_GOTPU|nr:N-acetylmuramoyl-L-alanine amidase [Gottschalkia purinilytica]KNF07182.1 sporulation-specific N-acetylmuramoyl-L-alanine amidase CwlC [Gottschalkia purinilytica]
MAKVFLDPGHGGKDPGAVGQGLQEKDIALSVTLKVGQILKNHGVDVYYSRTTDKYVELSDRARMANNLNTDIFISIHCNSFNGSAKGVETYSYPGSTTGAKLAGSIQNSIIADKVYTLNRGTKTANFAVLRQTTMVATLVETAFIDNVEDANILRNRQNDLAIAISKGILGYLGIKYNGGNKVSEHWGAVIKRELESHGVVIHEERFNDNITRAESMALALQVIKAIKGIK